MFSKWHQPAPRYTSYPTAPEWTNLDPQLYSTHLGRVQEPLALYFHIPFCRTMCLYCGCAVVLNRRPENEERYVTYLEKEMELISRHIKPRSLVTQIHFGGGTPTKLHPTLFSRLFQSIQRHFEIDFSKEVAIEIDPRTVLENGGEKLKLLKELGFNRVSFGVQDTDPKVQEAVKRRQSAEMTKETYYLARALGFEKINIDLIYGLPYQTAATFERTISDILEMRPDRISLFSYAKVPWMKPHQKAIKENTLPSTEEKFQIYEEARERLIKSGYVGIGMDHFALREDEMAIAYLNKTLKRNFQGYTVLESDDLISFGTTAIGYVGHGYFQNAKTLQEYYTALDRNLLTTQRGRVLTKEDLLRKWVIHTLMCSFEIDKQAFFDRFHLDFDTHFPHSVKGLEELAINHPDRIEITPAGELWIRIVAMRFDAYMTENLKEKFSQSV